METLATQFDAALSRIEVDPEPARKAQEEVRRVLHSNEKLTNWGVDTILIGSYSRGTGIHPGKDVDVFAKLSRLDVSMAPGEVFEAVRDILLENYGSRATAQARSIKVQFPDDFCADVVPAVRSGSRWAIPSRDPKVWFDTSKRWHVTDPENLGRLTHDRNTTPVVSGRGAYVPVVKLVRQIRAHHLRGGKPGGLYFEIATYWAFNEISLSESTFAELLQRTLVGVAGQLSTGRILIDPALDVPFDPAPSSDDLNQAGRKFAALAADATRALSADKCEAARLWRSILGENPDGKVFPIPEGCDEQGREVAPVRAVATTGPNQARPFA